MDIKEEFEKQDERDKKFDAILDGIHAFFTGTAALEINSLSDATHILFVRKP